MAFALLLLQIPPATASDKVTMDPRHTPDGPLILPAVGDVLNVITWVADTVPQLLVTL